MTLRLIYLELMIFISNHTIFSMASLKPPKADFIGEGESGNRI